MQLLVVCQAIDADDPVLGFFVRWIEEISKHFEHVRVICLRKGSHVLPGNVVVHSLGKENGPPHYLRRLVYAWRFLRLAWRLRHEYDSVFVHMNQEYILMAGPLWKLLGKRIFLWRNHYAGSWLTDVAAAFCTKVFCTSKHSYTARYKKTALMPVGVDTKRFTPDASVTRKPHSILFLSRMSPSKRLEMLIDALATLARDSVDFSATFVGSPLPKDEPYYEALKEKVSACSLSDRVQFLPGIPNAETPDLYRAHEIFVNTSQSGMFDKTLFEAAACGCTVLASSKDFAALTDGDTYFSDTEELAKRLRATLSAHINGQPAAYITDNSLEVLSGKLARTIQ